MVKNIVTFVMKLAALKIICITTQIEIAKHVVNIYKPRYCTMFIQKIVMKQYCFLTFETETDRNCRICHKEKKQEVVHCPFKKIS